MNFESIKFDAADGVATICMNRPKQLNALSHEMLDELLAAFEACKSRDDIRVVILTGEGRSFCSGADLGGARGGKEIEDENGAIDLGKALEERYNPLIMSMQELPKPVIAAVNGVAAGAGCSLALMADMTIAARDAAQFLQAFVRIGLLPDAGSTWLLPRTVGFQRALGFSLLGKPITAQQAHEWGLIWETVEDEQLMVHCNKLGKELAAGPSIAYAEIKRALQLGSGQSLPDQLQHERIIQRKLGHTEDFSAGVNAFLDKSKPQFKGR